MQECRYIIRTTAVQPGTIWMGMGWGMGGMLHPRAYNRLFSRREWEVTPPPLDQNRSFSAHHKARLPWPPAGHLLYSLQC